MSSGFGQVPVVLLASIGVLAVALTSFLSAVDIAVGRLSKALVQDLADEGQKRAPALLELVGHRARTSLALRGARVTMQTVAIVSLTVAVVDLFIDADLPWWMALLTAIFGIGTLEFFAVSLLPYLLVTNNYVKIALWGTGLTTRLSSLSKLFRPFQKLAKRNKPIPSPDTAPDSRLAVSDDLREIIDEVGQPDDFDDDDREMLRSVFELGQTLVREVMVPRTSMITIDEDETLEKALQLFVRSGFSRIPVVGDNIDDVVGILYFKDVVHRLLERPELTDSVVRGVARTPVFIPEMRLADNELRAMQAGNSHLALVVDEYGGIAGLVTMEDLLEELVGELTDEHDRFEMEPEQLGPNAWRVPARFPLGDLEDLLGVEIDEDTVDSVGGLLTMRLGRVLLPGSSTISDGLFLEAEEAQGRRREVVSILVKRVDDEVAEGYEEVDQ